ncbi:MAG TPA: translation initiation factor IF-2 [Thermodesulfobacteriota bacterium]|nr:translation initiation factor IF-2 [Thermodesulfobacteriota bacterium]
MANVRVYDLSKELNVPNKVVIDVAKRIGIPVSSHASAVSQEEARKIKAKLQESENNGQTSPGEEDHPIKEEVKVFRSESGEEVVERRKGRNVIIRKKKKTVQEPEVQESQVEKEKTGIEAPPISQEIEVGAKVPGDGLGESEEYKTSVSARQEETRASDVISVEHELDGIGAEEKSKGELEESEQRLEKGEVKRVEEEEQKEEAESKTVKKKRKAKPRKEEIIDEETLEELRKAFKAKFPGRRREYLVDDRRPRNRSSAEGIRREKAPYERGQKEPLKPSGLPFEETKSAQVIPFPTKPGRRLLKVGESISVGDLAKKMSVKAGDVIKKLMSMGSSVTINQSIDHETATLVAEEFGFEVSVDRFEEEELLLGQGSNVPDELFPRPPVVTVMGHVDHGKTTLLDAIRKTNVAGGEAGGITQHIGAYSVDVDERKVVFVDTPGHEAFTAMRARGAQVTDVVILVVAADDGVMPQTVEAVDHARAAGVPIVVALNKVDKPEANPEKVKRQLADIGLVPEEWGGETLLAEVSAKKNMGIKDLLELLLLQADVLEIRANPHKRANGVVIEAELDKGRGPVATVIVKEGTLKVGDYVVAGTTYGRVRALIDDKGDRVDEAGPSMPVEILGLSGVTNAGQLFYVVKDEKTAKDIFSYRESKEREKFAAKERKLSLESLYDSLKKGETKELPLIIKADTQGSAEAVKEAITGLSTDKCRVKIVHTGVGAVNETDVVLASASNAVIVGFNVRPDVKAMEAAERERVSLELHTVIYNAVDRIRNAMEGLLEPVIKERVVGHADVRDTFSISKVGTIAGCYVTDGKIVRGHNIRVLRDGVVIFEGKISSLKRFKDDVREVQAGYECGIGVENFNDIKVGDTLEVYTFDEIKQKL